MLQAAQQACDPVLADSAVDPEVLVGHRNEDLACHTQAATPESVRHRDLVD